MGPLQRPVNMCKSLPLSHNQCCGFKEVRTMDQLFSFHSQAGAVSIESSSPLLKQVKPWLAVLCLIVLSQCGFLPARSEAGLNIAHKASTVFLTGGRGSSDFEKAKSAFSEPPIVPLFSPTGREVSRFPKRTECFFRAPNWSTVFPHRGRGVSDFQNAKSAF